MTKAKLEDVAAASPLIVFYSFAVAGLALQIVGQLSGGTISFNMITSVAVEFSVAAFACVQIILFFVRKLPVAKYRGVIPRLTAVVGSNSASLFLLLPSVNRSIYLRTLSSLLIIGGTVGSVLVVCQLGKAFSVTPQARTLVTTGPYRVVRHPLYLTELIATFGLMWLYREPWALLIFLLTLGLQLVRMNLEERILLDTFPLYVPYCRGTARLIPYIY